MWLGNWKTALLHAFDVKLNGLMNELSDLGATFADRYATREVWDVCAKA